MIIIKAATTISVFIFAGAILAVLLIAFNTASAQFASNGLMSHSGFFDAIEDLRSGQVKPEGSEMLERFAWAVRMSEKGLLSYSDAEALAFSDPMTIKGDEGDYGSITRNGVYQFMPRDDTMDINMFSLSSGQSPIELLVQTVDSETGEITTTSHRLGPGEYIAFEKDDSIKLLVVVIVIVVVAVGVGGYAFEKMSANTAVATQKQKEKVQGEDRCALIPGTSDKCSGDCASDSDPYCVAYYVRDYASGDLFGVWRKDTFTGCSCTSVSTTTGSVVRRSDGVVEK